MNELPPLNALKAFRSVGQHGSISRAALELCVTPGAISKQIQQLESFLDVSLFVRRHRELALTEKGERYLAAISQAFSEIKFATERVRGSPKSNLLRIRSYTTFSIRWLIPHSTQFLSANPEISLDLTTSQDPVDFSRDNIDCAIRLGRGDWPGVSATRLIDNIILPVCSPAYLINKGIKTPKDLLSCSLLHIKRRPEDWGLWFASCGFPDQPIPRGMVCENSEIAYSAAKEGLGIAIAQYFLVRDDIESGRLVRPLMHTYDCGEYTYYLITPSGAQQHTHSQKFKEWILEHIKGSKDRP